MAARTFRGWLLVLPVLVALALPDLGLAGTALTDLLFTSSRGSRVLGCGLFLMVSVVLAVVVGWMLERARWLTSRIRLSGPWKAGLLVGITFGVVLVGSGVVARSAAGSGQRIEAPASGLAPVVSDAASKVILLCIDGADLDDMILPMIEQGQLPTFARLKRQGAWGALESMEPGLSAVLWTTIITGKPPEDHGVWHFVAARLPGMTQVILRFPLHTGFNFHVFALAERLPGGLSLRLPYTSSMRRVEALWGIVGEWYPVGAYRWLVSWPAEPVNGFNVAESVVAGIETRSEIRQRMLRAVAPEHESRHAAHHPQALRAALEPDRRKIPVSELLAYADQGQVQDPASPDARFLRRSLRRSNLDQLLWLMREFRPVLTVASFYSVDAFCHRYAADWVRGGPFENAVPERYREVDRRLGELLEAIDPSTNVIVISDHGYDFIHNHHTYGPPGIFFGIGPAFAGGQKVEGLSLLDIAPMCLRILGLPLPEDMPGTMTGHYRRALRPELETTRPERRVPTYERGVEMDEGAYAPLDRGDEEQIRQQLRELGYIE